ncbi:hypothetical protein BOTBODRAFT_118833 [Botryobasidium botryosum FD-172 SS1]|uniref:Threonine/serine exporter-like N-terminal domain-containing protein n=1 Tax=Botryobasidium botryosum (strain FD-172 SS1) TaxID=930990 RepID=A0A067LYH0_BOTB1|nr:hypothetical protein BOTBODRAFT_118833 [Botryobasidium botryosum FD-172 SS1]
MLIFFVVCVFFPIAIESRHEYILKLARALMELGAPSHRIEGQLIATARILGVQATFHRFLAKIDVTLEHPDTGISVTKPVHADARLDLGRLVRLHKIYKDVVHDNMGAEEGARKLRKLLDEPPIHGPKAQCALGFACGALICGLAFGGSPVDMLVAGTCSLFVQMLGGVAARVEMFAPIFEFTMAFFISTLARVLTSIPTSTQIFCYSAIATPGIVLILPGFLVVCGALDLASKNKEAGVIKIGAAFFHALFLVNSFSFHQRPWH